MQDRVGQEAIRWFVRLRAADVSSSDRHAHNDWLLSDAQHAEAYDRVCREWAAMDDLDDWARGELTQLNLADSARARHRVTFAVSSFAVASMAVVALLLWPALGDRPDSYSTLKAEQRQITLEDGSRIHLNSATDLEVSIGREIREITVRRGESIFDVKSDGSRPFIVRAGDSSVIALGTRFSVDYRERALQVTVLEGKVAIVQGLDRLQNRIRNSTTKSVEDLVAEEFRSVILEPDQQVAIDVAGEIAPVVEIDSSNETSWSEGKLIFDETPLREVIREISRYIPGDIRVAEDVPDHPITGIIQIRNQESMLDFIAEVAPITPIRQSASMTVVRQAPAKPPSNG